MKPILQIQLGQSLTLTPQLRQAIRLLQMSSIELEQEITLALESNPLLERLDEPTPEPAAPEENDSTEDAPGEIEEDPLDLPDWDDGGGSDTRTHDDWIEHPQAQAEEDLHDHLLWQLNLTALSAQEHAIAMTVIDAINEDGYLTETLDDLRKTLLPEIESSNEQIERILGKVQCFDPPGVGARSLSECLLLQLAQHESDPVVELARVVARDHLETLARSGPGQLATQLRQEPALMDKAVHCLRSLDPRPGAAFAREQAEYIIPDARAVHRQGHWYAVLGPGCRHYLGINHHYQALITSASKEDASYLRNQLQEARWLIKSLETRADTVLRVAETIVARQRDFLDYGPEAMRPLVLREVAEELELHESTISRVTTRKYLHTPRGTFEFKYFFSSGLATVDGGSASSTAIQAMLKRLIDQENPGKPLSDAALVKALAREGVSAARRTVAKYREAMNIPSSNERRRLG